MQWTSLSLLATAVLAAVSATAYWKERRARQSAEERIAKAQKISLEQEAALMQQLNVLLNLFDNAPTAISVTIDGRVEFANDILSTLVRTQVGESVIKAYVFPDQRKEVARRISAGESIKDCPIKLYAPDGSVRDFLLSCMPYDYDGRLAQLNWFVDVTSLKAAEHAMEEAKARAEDAARAKGDFLANMSHEIRTPMNAIIGLSGLALKSETSQRTKDFLLKIQQSGEHLLGIINDILDFSKVESGKMEVESISFELNTVIDNVVNLISEKADSKGLELLCYVDPEIPRLLLGDPLRIGQVLINYANNAVKFTKVGEIRIAITARERSENQVLLHFSVTDTGIGLNEEQQSRLFKSFEQADKSTTRQFGGTGLGLAISKHLALAMNGEVGVDSVPGQGSSFWFTARLGIGSQDHIVSLPRVDLNGVRVLVVDDNDAAALILCDMLSAIGFMVQSVDSGAAALAAIQAAEVEGKPYEFVMMDWLMPGMDGLEAVREIQALHARKTPCVMMVTAHRRQELIMGAGLLGIDHVLSKPVNGSLLVDTMMQLMGQTPLQRKATPTVTHSALEESMHQLAGARILLVEDNEINQMVAHELLGSVGLRVDVAENGREALAYFAAHRAEEQPYDLVLMDMQMPVMDGVTATRELRATHGSDTPIVAMTANAMKEDRDCCLQAGMNAVVTKPIRPDELWQALLTWVRPRQGLGLSAGAHKANQEQDSQFDLDLQQSLAQVADLDVQAGLSRVLGNTQFYANMLRKFLAGQADAVVQIRACLEAEDYAGAELIAHTLKGVSSSLGATRLSHCAEGLERSLRTRVTTQAHMDAVNQTEELLHVLLSDLRSIPALVPQPVHRQALTNEERIRAFQILQTIGECLAEDDARASELWESHESLLREVVPTSEHLAAAIRKYDFELALHILRDVQAD